MGLGEKIHLVSCEDLVGLDYRAEQRRGEERRKEGKGENEGLEMGGEVLEKER